MDKNCELKRVLKRFLSAIYSQRPISTQMLLVSILLIYEEPKAVLGFGTRNVFSFFFEQISVPFADITSF